MELEELKIIWKSSERFHQKNETEIASLLKGKSKSVIEKLKRNVMIEIIFTVAGGIALLLYALTLESSALKWTSISIITLFVAYTIYYIKKLLLLRTFNAANQNLKFSIEIIIDSLNSYLKYYRRSYMFLYPLYFILALFFSVIELGTDEFLRIATKLTVLPYLIFTAIVLLFCSTWLTQWYLKKLYGTHLKKLRTLLDEIQDQPM